MNRPTRLLFRVAFASLVAAGPCLGAAPATSPATAPAELLATITAVEGLVQVRGGADEKWVAAKVGMVIGQGAEFRTGLRSAVQFQIPPDQVVTLDRLGTVKLIDALKTATSVKTDLGMKYGRVRYDIESAGLQHESTIRSPGAALAVTGTRVGLYDQPPFKPEAVSFTGRAHFRNARGQMVAFGGKDKANISSEEPSAAQAAMEQSLLASFGVERTDQQVRELTYLFSREAQLVGNVVSSRSPVSDRELPTLLGGNLDFVLRWNTPGAATDLNLAVQTPLRETFGNPPFILSLVPGNASVGRLLSENFPQSSPSGGSVGLNSIGPAGIEIASFTPGFPKGIYTIAAYNFVPPDPRYNTTGLPKVPFTIVAYEHGHRLPLLTNFEAASAGLEPPKFGYVFHGSVALSEIQGTAVIVRGTPADYKPPVIPKGSKRPVTPSRRGGGFGR